MFCYKNNEIFHSADSIPSIVNTHNHNTRLASKSNYYIPRKRTDRGKKSFSYIDPQICKKYLWRLNLYFFTVLRKNSKTLEQQVKSSLFHQVAMRGRKQR